MSREITVRYRSLDRYSKSAKFKTLAGAQRFAAKWVGATPDVSEMFGYAVSGDGMGKVTWEGCTVRELFPQLGEEL
jgi:hypothetical protein